MTRVRFLLFGVLLAVAGMVGASLVGAVGTTTAMPPSVFRVTITNMTDPPTPISPGALVGHCEDGAFWSSGGLASAGLELIAEVGNPSAAVAVEQDETAMGMSFVQERYTIGEVGPGESVSVNVIFEFGCKLSSAHMLVHSNDAFVGAQSVGMWDPDTHLPLENVSVELTAYDAGTEENSEIASGFDGGQPDPSRGAENLDNGVATSEPISASTQWPGVQATLTVEFLDPFVEEDELESDDSVSDDSVETTLWRMTLWKTILWKMTLWKTTLWKTTLWKTTPWKTTLWKTTLWKMTLWRMTPWKMTPAVSPTVAQVAWPTLRPAVRRF